MTRPSYRAAIEWIAHNDEAGEMDVETMSGLISVVLIADLFGKEAEAVARAVVKIREAFEWTDSHGNKLTPRG